MTRPITMGLVIPFFLFCFGLVNVHTGYAQWRKLANFAPSNPSNTIEQLALQSIYFLDLPGPPRIGFVGLGVPDSDDSTGDGAQLWKTTDGGYNWRKVAPLTDRALLGYGVSDITFKDSLTGWFTLDAPGSNFGGVYKTTDAGETWTELIGSGWNLNYSICYHAATDLLFSFIPRRFLGFQRHGNYVGIILRILFFRLCIFF